MFSKYSQLLHAMETALSSVHVAAAPVAYMQLYLLSLVKGMWV